MVEEFELTLKVFGTPAEEGGGGKIIMLERNAFAGVHGAIMVHRAPIDARQMYPLARARFRVCYKGKAAHASMFPYEGRNAADAMVVNQVALGLLRQHLNNASDLDSLLRRVYDCFEAAAKATGTTAEIGETAPRYTEFLPNEQMLVSYVRNAAALGRSSSESQLSQLGGSTDMGDISQAMPAIHPLIGIGSFPAVNHQPEFAATCVLPCADSAVVDGAVAMAWTILDLARDQDARLRLTTGKRVPACLDT